MGVSFFYFPFRLCRVKPNLSPRFWTFEVRTRLPTVLKNPTCLPSRRCSMLSPSSNIVTATRLGIGFWTVELFLSIRFGVPSLLRRAPEVPTRGLLSVGGEVVSTVTKGPAGTSKQKNKETSPSVLCSLGLLHTKIFSILIQKTFKETW